VAPLQLLRLFRGPDSFLHVRYRSIRQIKNEKDKKTQTRNDEAQQKIITGRKIHESNKFVYFSSKHILYIID
jgi:hypothetical protein